jgi:hypothetical protein
MTLTAAVRKAERTLDALDRAKAAGDVRAVRAHQRTLLADGRRVRALRAASRVA